MDNDNKVIKMDDNKKQIHQEVMLFLGDELTRLHKAKSNRSYNLEDEYAKTKKNKSPFVALMLTGCLLVILGLAFLMHTVISAKNEEITVSLTEFDDLNLKSLLDTVSSAQTNYDNAVKNKAQIEADMEYKLNEAKSNRDNDIFVVDSMNIGSKKTYNERVAVINKEYDLTVKAIHKEFDEKVLQADKEVQAYKTQLAEFDTAKVESAREQEKARDSERQLRELENKKMAESYEKRIAELESTINDLRKKSTGDIRSAVAEVSKKYQAEIDALDPTLKDRLANKIIDDAKSEKTAEVKDFNAASLLNEKTLNSPKVMKFINNYQQIYDNFKYLDDVVASIPQKNSIPSYVSAARALVNEMGKSYVDTTTDFYYETEHLNAQISQLNLRIAEELKNREEMEKNLKARLEAPYENLLAAARTSAAVISASDLDNIEVYVSPKARYLIDEGGAAAEIRLTKAVKGTLIKNGEDSFYFKVAENKDGTMPEINFEEIVPGTLVKILSK